MTGLQITGTTQQFQNQTPNAKDLIYALLTALPKEAFPQQESLKVKIPCWKLDQNEMNSLFTEVENFFGKEKGIACNTLMRDGEDTVNIPEDLLKEIKGQDAAAFINLIKPYLQKVAERTNVLKYFKTVTWGAHIDQVWEAKEHNAPAGYKITYDIDGKLDPVRSIGEALNAALDEELFQTMIMDDGSAVILLISEENVRKLAENSNLKACEEILRDPDNKCKDYMNQSGLVNKFMLRVDENIFHRAPRAERKDVYQEVKQQAAISSGEGHYPKLLPETF
ncbi:MAG: hypothetical protein ACT4OY_08005 [Alphaproteobacteria bacterium]